MIDHRRRQVVIRTAFGVAKVAPRRWQVFATRWGRPDLDRRIGPVFKTQWEATQQARHYSERRAANLRRHGYRVW
jgi:hypothetical protein